MSATSLPATAIFSHQAATLDENFSNSTRVAVSSDNATAKPFLALASFAAASDRTRLATDSTTENWTRLLRFGRLLPLERQLLLERQFYLVQFIHSVRPRRTLGECASALVYWIPF